MTIEELNIEIAADSEAANSGLKKLTATLEKFKKALPDGSKMNKARDALKALAEAFGTYNNVTQNVAANNKEINKSVKELTDSTKKLTDATQKNNKSDNKSQSVRKKIKEIKDDIQKAWNTLGGFFNESNRYIESLNLFEVTMGNSAKSALDFAENVSDAMGIDVSEWIEYQGTFQQLATGFGVASDAASVMSQNLTQLSYDLASFFNVDTETAAGKLSSAMAGQIKGLREFGIDTSVAALQQYALENNITKTVSSMTQAEKTFLRYNLILEKSVNIQGDMARTLITPANSIRILNSQIVQLKRQLGNIVSVFAVKLIPIIQAVVRVAAEAAEKIAKLLGFELPKIDYSGLDTNGFTDDIEDAENGLDNATASAKEFRKQLMGFDELNIINENKQTSTSGGSIKNESLDFGVDDLKSYDFLKDMTKETDKWYDSIKKVADIIVEVSKQIWSAKTAIGVIIGLVALSKVVKWGKGVIGSIKDIITKINEFKGSSDKAKSTLGKISGVAVSVATAVANAFVGRDFFKSLVDGSLTATQTISDIAIVAGDLAIAFAAGGPLGIAISLIGLAIGGIVGLWEANEEKMREMVEASEEYKKVSENVSFVEEAARQAAKKVDALNDGIDKYHNIDISEGKAKDLIDQIYDLAGKSEKSKKEISELNGLIFEFNSKDLGDIQIAFDEVSGKIIDVKTQQGLLKDELLQTVDAFYEEARAASLKELMRKATEDEIGIQSDLLKALDNEKQTRETIEGVRSRNADLEREDLELYNKAYDEFGTLRAEIADEEFRVINDRRTAINDEIGLNERKIETLEEEAKKEREKINELISSLSEVKGKQTDITNEYITMTDEEGEVLDKAKEIQKVYDEIQKKRFGDGWVDFRKEFEKSLKAVKDGFKDIDKLDLSVFKQDYSSKKTSNPLKIPGFATGGFPSAGQMFYAREDGVPEMVGRIGNRTAVANNDQITAAIANAVYNAMIASGGGKSSSQTNVTLELDGDVVARKVISYNNRQVAQTGASPLLV